MSRSGKISVTLTSQQLSKIDRIVGSGEFASASEVVREAVRAWLARRPLHAGRHGAAQFTRSIQARHGPSAAEPCERVELLFDAGDAKA
jgi:Arc/MetJ-type ribon-helix-helix transcriptional regulator